jgi:glutathione S-transferase
VKDDKDYYDAVMPTFALSLVHANADCKMRCFLFDKSGISPELNADESENMLQTKCLEKLKHWENALGETVSESNLYLCGDKPGYLDLQLASKMYFAFQLFESGLANLGKSFQEAAPFCFGYLQRMEKRESWKKALGSGYEVASGRLHVPMLRVVCNKFVAMCPEINGAVTIPALQKARKTNHESNLYLCGDTPGYLDLQLASKLYFAFQLFESGLANLGKSFQEAAPLCFEYLQRMEKRESWKKAFGSGYEVALGRLHVPMLRVLSKKFVTMCPEINDAVTIPALEKARRTKLVRSKSQKSESVLGKKVVSATLCL